MSSDSHALDYTRNLRARSAATSAAEKIVPSPTGIVHYRSRGRVLVIGGEEAQWLAARLEQPLHAEILLTHGDDEPGVPTTALGGRAMVLSGYLGAFEARLGSEGLPNHQVLQADLVIDLSDTPLIDSELPPPGYWHFGTGPADLDAAVVALDGMTGQFEKPRFFDYDADTCAHGRAGQPGCCRCIDSCPADAIVSIGERVEVNPNLCQGGGICASVCPTGAMRYALPSPGDTAERVRTLLKTYLEAGGSDPMILFISDDDAGDLPPTPPNMLLVVVEELASVGHEIWLAALAWGARCVMLANGGSVPQKSLTALNEQVAMLRGLLQGLSLPRYAINLTTASGALAECNTAGIACRPAVFGTAADKRQLAALAIEHLREQTEAAPTVAPLPMSAPYGRILVDTHKCTLCMSCTSVCPAGALAAGDDTPRLSLFETKCVQCGICANACPEKAITLEARYLFDPEQRRAARVLHEDPPFCCVSCGKPFAPRHAIDTILQKLVDHPMFQTERARRRLQMCEDCRIVDAVQDDEAMQNPQFGASPRPPHHNG